MKAIHPDLAELLRYNRQPWDSADKYEQVVAEVAARHGISVATLRGRGRLRPVGKRFVSAARAEACRELIAFQELSTPQIAKRVGYANHTSVLYWTTLKGRDRFRRIA